MKRIIAIVLCLVTVAAAAFSLTACGASSSDKVVVKTVDQADADPATLTVALADDFAPYLYDAEGGVSGIDAEAAEVVSAQLDTAFEYIRVDRDAVKDGLNDGKFDLALCGYTAAQAGEIKKLSNRGLHFSDSCYGFIQGVLVDSNSSAGNLTEETIGESEYTIGVKKASTAEALLRRDVKDFDDRVKTYDTGIDAVNALVGHDVDCVITDLNPCYDYLEKYDSVKLSDQPYTHGAFYFISTDSKKIDDVNAAVTTLKDGKINSIEEKYISNDINFWTPFNIWFSKLKYDFHLNFIEKDRWKFLVTGLGNTLLLTLMAALLGVFIGIIIAAIRTTYDNNLETLKHNKGISYYLMGFFNAVSKLYLTVIRGTPVFVQLLIIFFVIFASSKNKMMVATLAFGINSGAYVAEILRGGIMAIDKGQFEAGRSIGFNYVQTMYYIIIPQVLKNVLPTLLNEFIALLKETSVACYVGVLDLTRAGNIIRGTTFTDLLPLLAVALIYLVVVLILTKIVGIIERRLRKSER
ncbi:MAG: transporter substrate-binding domain-containing protein [Ruminococcus sp.]|nr:transporter substrate-binding domain-containing protein [Ruminococcus sp.]